MIHYDLFAGIGGFSIAVDEVLDAPVRHIFCEWDGFCTQVLKKHWPDGEFWGDIAELVAHTRHLRQAESKEQTMGSAESHRTIITGGFPCQPFSQAGQRRGTADDRYKWPEMFEVIRNVSPDWVIAENVGGLVSWSGGLVLEQVCSDLESEGYEVWPLIVPAVAVNAPHRRDRVWIVAHRISPRSGDNGQPGNQRGQTSTGRAKSLQPEDRQTSSDNIKQSNSDATDSGREHGQPRFDNQHGQVKTQRTAEAEKFERFSPTEWDKNWPEVATELCGVDDGLPRVVGGVPYSRAKWRKESLKAYGNAIVPQVAIEIMKGIRLSND